MKPTSFHVVALLFMLFAINKAEAQRENTPSEALYYADAYADHYHVPRELVHAIIAQESGWRRTAVSEKGAVGLMQLMPGTAQRFGVRDRNSVSDNIGGGVRYLALLLQEFSGDLRLVVAAYYCGARPLAMRGLNYSNADVVAYVKAVRRRYLKEIELHSMKNPDTTLQEGNRP